MELESKQAAISIFINQVDLVSKCQQDCLDDLTLDNLRKLEAAQAGLAQAAQMIGALNAGKVIEIDEEAIDLRIADLKWENAKG